MKNLLFNLMLFPVWFLVSFLYMSFVVLGFPFIILIILLTSKKGYPFWRRLYDIYIAAPIEYTSDTFV